MPTQAAPLLSPAQLKAYTDIQNMLATAAVHLARLRAQGLPSEQDEMRVQNLRQACEGVLAYEEALKQSLGQ